MSSRIRKTNKNLRFLIFDEQISFTTYKGILGKLGVSSLSVPFVVCKGNLLDFSEISDFEIDFSSSKNQNLTFLFGFSDSARHLVLA